MADVLAVLLNFRRAENLRNIVRVLKAQTVVPRIAVWNNGERGSIDRSTVDYLIESSENLQCMSRWHAATLLGREYVFSLDDDLTIVNSDFLERCVRACRVYHDERIIGYAGRSIGTPPRYYLGGTADRSDGTEDAFTDVVLGRFMFMHVNLLNRVPMRCPYPDSGRGDDIWMSLNTSVSRRYHVLPRFTKDAFGELPDGGVGLADQPDHTLKRDTLVSNMLSHGEVAWQHSGPVESGYNLLWRIVNWGLSWPLTRFLRRSIRVAVRRGSRA